MESNQDNQAEPENENNEEEFLNLSITPSTNVDQCNIDEPDCEACQ